MARVGSAYAVATAILSNSGLIAASSSPTTSPVSSPSINPTTSSPTASPTSISPTTSSPTASPTSTSPTVSPTKYEGTGEWYADDVNGNLCAKDCADDGSDPDCSGVNHDTASWLQDTYATAADCCAAKFSYLDNEYCADRSSGDPVGTNKYYPDTATFSSCKMDSDVSLGPFHIGTLYASADDCCSGSLSWVNSEYCASRSEGGNDFTDKWYGDDASTMCKQDCDSSGGEMCLPMTETWKKLYASAEECCSAELSWVPSITCENSPTIGPTLSPSEGPSTKPTLAPSYSPTSVPSFSPTLSPTLSPSEGPSTNPTLAPSSSPTASPSSSPTAPPTLSPSKSPSTNPTNSPSNGPTSSPTGSPSSTPTVYEGTGEWYADDANGNLCSKDCADDGSDPECSGVNHETATWLENTYTTAADCCAEKFSYLDNEYCADRSSAEPAGTNKYYPDTATFSSCKMDSDPSLGPFNSGTLYATADECCAGSLSWVNSEYCASRSEGGTGFTDKWYGASSNCLQDCDSSGGETCQPMTETWKKLYTSAEECCSGELSWLPLANCTSV